MVPLLLWTKPAKDEVERVTDGNRSRSADLPANGSIFFGSFFVAFSCLLAVSFLFEFEKIFVLNSIVLPPDPKSKGLEAVFAADAFVLSSMSISPSESGIEEMLGRAL